MSDMSIPGTSQTGATQPTAPSTASALGGTQVSKDEFLQLLVAQIKNQDPLNPADGTQFLSELAQFSQLEQLIGIREGVAAWGTPPATGTTTNTTQGGN